jgi:hypothetical protein
MNEYSAWSENLVAQTQGAPGNAGVWPFGALIQYSSTPNSVSVRTSLKWSEAAAAGGPEWDDVYFYWATTLNALTSEEHIANPDFSIGNPHDPEADDYVRFTVGGLQPYNYYYIRARAGRFVQNA